MQKFFLTIPLLMISGVQVVAQKTFKLSSYMPDKVGQVWQFKNNVKDGMSPIIVSNAEKVMFSAIEILKRTENNGDYRLQKITGNGLEIYQLYFVGNRIIEYEKPVILFSNDLKVGKVHKSSTRYKTLVNNELKEQGIQIYETKVERIENAETPFKSFENCLVIRTIALRIDESGAQKGYELEEWYAKGVGITKVVGTLFWKNAKGETTRTFKVDAVLEMFKG